MKIMILGGDDMYTDIVYNTLAEKWPIEAVVVEDGVPKSTIVKRRMKKLGVPKVIGQVLFQLLCVPVLRFRSKKRVMEILETEHLNASADYRHTEVFHKVSSVNDPDVIALLQKVQPDVVIVNGTRIIKKKVLNCIPGVFINMHMGITPKYRGVHGGYWAFYENDREHAGVTVHLVDPGIDTGGILYQGVIKTGKQDTFITYPYLQLAEGLKLELKALQDAEQGTLHTIGNDLPSRLWSHPTLMEYLKARLHGVR